MITEPYRVIRWRGRPMLFCLVCDQMSTFPEDVMHAFCPYCSIFLAELPEDYRRPSRTVRNLPGWQARPANDPNNQRPPEGG